MALPRPARHVDVMLSMSVGLVAVVVLAYIRMPDFQDAVHAIALDIEEMIFGGDVAGAFNADEEDE